MVGSLKGLWVIARAVVTIAVLLSWPVLLFSVWYFHKFPPKVTFTFEKVVEYPDGSSSVTGHLRIEDGQ